MATAALADVRPEPRGLVWRLAPFALAALALTVVAPLWLLLLSPPFAQALHYAVWLVLLPAADRDGSARSHEATPSLRVDLGAAGTRSVYLSLVLFHGWLEVAVVARWAVARDTAPWSH